MARSQARKAKNAQAQDQEGHLKKPAQDATADRRKEILDLQRGAGNQAVSGALRDSGPGDERTAQGGLTINQPGDQYEQEADRAAGTAISSTRSPQKVEAGEQNVAQGDVSGSSDKGEKGQRQGGGQPLPDALRSQLEQDLGADLSDVRIHADTSADEFSRSLWARAVTVGKDIYLRRGAFQPGTIGGQELLAHELAHTVQQSQATAVPDIQRAIEPPSVEEIEFGLESILGPKPEAATVSVTDEQLLEVYRYLKSLRRAVAMSDPAFEQSVQMLLEGWFPGQGKHIWDESRKPLAGYVGTAFGGQARKRMQVAEKQGLARSRERWTKKRLTGSDVVFFSGHHYARYGDPGEFDAIDLRKVKFTSTRAKLLMISSCAGLDNGSLRILRRKFPNAYILAWRFGSPLNQKGLMRKFLARLPEDVDLEDPASIQEILRQWREYIESLASDPKGISPNGLGYATPDGTLTYYVKRKGSWMWVTK